MSELPALYISIIGGLVVAVITGIGGLFVGFLKKRTAIRKWKEEEEVKLEIELPDRLKLVKSPIFIRTMGQIESPHDSNCITISDNRFDLADKLLKEIFSPNEGVWKKRFAILGGTGMGKSTFSAFLFYKYINCYKYKECKYPIYIKYLGQKDVLNDLRKMSKNNDVSLSVLILDALDENTDAVKDTKAFLNKIEEITDKYRIVILTSRTQFFPNKESEPTKGNVLQNSHSYRFLSWEKIYISPFSEEETIRYLETKYKIPSKEYSKAKKIADLTNDLLMRPMILSFVDDLLDLADNKTIMVSEIYARIIDKWLSDECEGQALSKSDLFTFSKNLSFYIYEKWNQSGESYVTEEEFQNFLSKNDYQDNPYSFRGRSLVNRKGDGSIKFSHKSFWEFFLSINSIENPGKSFKPDVFDTAEIFAKELYQMYLNGKELLNISYCPNPIFEINDNFSLLDNILEEGRDNLLNPSLSENERNSFANKLICKYWELSIRRLPCQYEKLPYKQFKHNSRGELLQHGDKLTEPIEESLANLQHCFLNNQLSCKELFSVIEDCHQTIHLYSHLPMFALNRKSSRISTKLISKNFVVFPFLYSENFLKNFLSRNYINIGIGFNDDKTIYEIINKCTNNNIIDVICVNREGDDLDSHVRFISGLSNYVSNVSFCIIVVVKINNVYLYYVVNKKTLSYTSEQIRLCLTNMHSCYLQIIGSCC